MHQRPRTLLRQLVLYYGPAIHTEPRRVEAFLQDLCGQYHREIFVLVHAQEQQIPKELLAAGPMGGEPVLWQRLSRRLQDRLALTADAADWAVESWAMALGVAPARYGYPRPLRFLFDYLPGSFPGLKHIPLRQDIFRGRSFGEFDVQWKRSKLSWRSGGVWAAASLLVLILFGTIAMIYRPNPTEALSRFWPSDLVGAEQVLSSAEIAEQLRKHYPLPREARIGDELVAVLAEPVKEAAPLGLLGPAGATVTIDDYTADGRWSHISAPVDGWIANQAVTVTGPENTGQVVVHLAPMIGRITVAGLRVRQAPTLDAAVLGELQEETQVVIIATLPDRAWFHIVEPFQGWVSGIYVAEDNPQTGSLEGDR
jgi:hypothetical protein